MIAYCFVCGFSYRVCGGFVKRERGKVILSEMVVPGMFERLKKMADGDWKVEFFELEKNECTGVKFSFLFKKMIIMYVFKIGEVLEKKIFLAIAVLFVLF